MNSTKNQKRCKACKRIYYPTMPPIYEEMGYINDSEICFDCLYQGSVMRMVISQMKEEENEYTNTVGQPTKG
jgi:hypothetical protein